MGSTQEWLEAITGTSKATGKMDPWLWEHIFSLACFYTTDSLLDYPPTLPPQANNPVPQQEILSDCRTLLEHDPTVFMRKRNIFFLILGSVAQQRLRTLQQENLVTFSKEIYILLSLLSSASTTF